MWEHSKPLFCVCQIKLWKAVRWWDEIPEASTLSVHNEYVSWISPQWIIFNIQLFYSIVEKFGVLNFYFFSLRNYFYSARRHCIVKNWINVKTFIILEKNDSFHRYIKQHNCFKHSY